MKKLLIIIIALISITGYSQNTDSLSDLLWNSVHSCYMNFEDMNDDGKPDFDKIDDSKNGYLQISGIWPTCGCGCTSTVGAYKNNKNQYILLQSDYRDCDWYKHTSSNKKIQEVLPENFGINDFLKTDTSISCQRPYFFLDVEIPRIGTDTKIKLELVPFGLYVKGDGLLTYQYIAYQHKYISGIKTIATNCKNENTLDFLLKSEYDKITKEDMIIINNVVGTDDSRFKSLEEITKYIREIREVYNIYVILENTEFLLGWNREESRFYIKSKGAKPKKISFKEFIIKNEFWGPRC